MQVAVTNRRKPAQWNIPIILVASFTCSLIFINLACAKLESEINTNVLLGDDNSCFLKGNRTLVIQKNEWAQCLLSARYIHGTVPIAKDDLIPSWVNLTLFTAGQKFATKNIGYVGVSHFFALIFENFIPDIKDVLFTTGSTSTIQSAIKRYTATATQVILWYRNSLLNPAEKAILLNSLSTVRKLHKDGSFKVKTKMGNNLNSYMDSKQHKIFQELWNEQKNRPVRSIVFDERFWEALEKDLLLSNVPENNRHFPRWNTSSEVPISQFSQALTQFSFAGLPVLFHKELGMSHVTKQEMEGYIHMWAVLGHALGIKDEFNICLNANFEDSLAAFRDIYNSYFLPAMFQFDWRVRVQLGVYLDALHIGWIISPRLIMYRFLRDIVKIQPLNLFRQLTAVDRMYIAVVDSLMSNNLDANRFLMNRGGMYFLDVNGYHNFGSYYNSDSMKSKGAYYTKEQLVL